MTCSGQMKKDTKISPDALIIAIYLPSGGSELKIILKI